MIRARNDFPVAIKKQLEPLETTLHIEIERAQDTTRARLEYEDGSRDSKYILGRSSLLLIELENNFQYLLPVLQTLPSHFESTALLGGRSFHFPADPIEIETKVNLLLTIRDKANIKAKPLLVWEPRPSSCTSVNQNACFQAARKVNMFTPNHVEPAAIFGCSKPENVDADVNQALALRFVDSGSSIVVRAGEIGCSVPSGSCSHRLSPYYKPTGGAPGQLSLKIVDPTGTGNAFVRAFTTALLETRDMYQAACYGNVGASFALEQFGLPELRGCEEGEVWNDVNPSTRLKEYMSRLDVDG